MCKIRLPVRTGNAQTFEAETKRNAIWEVCTLQSSAETGPSADSIFASGLILTPMFSGDTPFGQTPAALIATEAAKSHKRRQVS